MSARYGPGGAWLELDSGVELPMGPYAVKVLVHEPLDGDGLRAFVVNTFRSGVAYDGEVEADGTLVFVGRVGKRLQRVIYESHGDRVRFFVEESADGGATFSPHSEAWWTRAGGGAAAG